MCIVCFVVETYLTGHSVRTELAKAQRRLDPPEQSHHVKVLNPAPGNKIHNTIRHNTTETNNHHPMCAVSNPQ